MDREPAKRGSDSPAEESYRLWFLLVAIGYTAFVIYGSLVPLEFRARPMAGAIEAFRNIAWLNLGIGSRADWVANILLFVPLAYLWMGRSWGQSGLQRVAVSFLVFGACVALSVAVEFTQLFFPRRTVSLNDILAESIGAAAGVALWWATGRRVSAWLDSWRRTASAPSIFERMLFVYLFVLIGYSLLPLDLTLSPVELYRKWRDGRVLLIPFTAAAPNLAEKAYNLISDIAIWVPPALLWRLSGRASEQQVLYRMLSIATLLEAAQLLVYSRVTDLTDILLAGVGAWIGVLAARPFAVSGPVHSQRSAESSAHLVLWWVAALVTWIVVLAAVFWYPFNFRTDWAFVQARVEAIPRVPLSSYYFGSEFRAVTELLHKTGFFLPLGALLAIGSAFVQRRFWIAGGWLDVVAVAMIAGFAAGIEAVQILLPGKNADPTDLFLEGAGGLLGYFATRVVSRSWYFGRSTHVGKRDDRFVTERSGKRALR